MDLPRCGMEMLDIAHRTARRMYDSMMASTIPHEV
jgi:hypothetical protein